MEKCMDENEPRDFHKLCNLRKSIMQNYKLYTYMYLYYIILSILFDFNVEMKYDKISLLFKCKYMIKYHNECAEYSKYEGNVSHVIK